MQVPTGQPFAHELLVTAEYENIEIFVGSEFTLRSQLNGVSASNPPRELSPLEQQGDLGRLGWGQRSQIIAHCPMVAAVRGGHRHGVPVTHKHP